MELLRSPSSITVSTPKMASLSFKLPCISALSASLLIILRSTPDASMRTTVLPLPTILFFFILSNRNFLVSSLVLSSGLIGVIIIDFLLIGVIALLVGTFTVPVQVVVLQIRYMEPCL